MEYPMESYRISCGISYGILWNILWNALWNRSIQMFSAWGLWGSKPLMKFWLVWGVQPPKARPNQICYVYTYCVIYTFSYTSYAFKISLYLHILRGDPRWQATLLTPGLLVDGAVLFTSLVSRRAFELQLYQNHPILWMATMVQAFTFTTPAETAGLDMAARLYCEVYCEVDNVWDSMQIRRNSCEIVIGML